MATDTCDGAVVRSPRELHVHPALDELRLASTIEELNEAAQSVSQLQEPILIAIDGTILAGFAYWRLALVEGRQEVHCIEYSFNEEESLHFIIRHHWPERGWNAFVRTRLALKLEPAYKRIALDNIRAGGKYKGSANLPAAQYIDVRQEIAKLAAVGTRNVSNVKTILKCAHPRLIEAVQEGTLTINRAIHLCKLPWGEQLEQFVRHIEERATNKVIRGAIGRRRPKNEKTRPDAITLLDTIRFHEACQPGSVEVRVGRLRHTVILLGQDLLSAMHSQEEGKV